ncbi:hypothetical protein HDU67_008631, partial [Dinochytrium kinnereticum]
MPKAPSIALLLLAATATSVCGSLVEPDADLSVLDSFGGETFIDAAFDRQSDSDAIHGVWDDVLPSRVEDESDFGRPERTYDRASAASPVASVTGEAKGYAECSQLRTKGSEQCSVFPKWSPNPSDPVRYQCLDANV